MHHLVPPLCLLLALAMFIAGFAMLAVGAPEPGVDFHRARAGGDEGYADVLEANLLRRQVARRVLLGGLFVGGIVMIAAAFHIMRPSGR